MSVLKPTRLTREELSLQNQIKRLPSELKAQLDQMRWAAFDELSAEFDRRFAFYGMVPTAYKYAWKS